MGQMTEMSQRKKSRIEVGFSIVLPTRIYFNRGKQFYLLQFKDHKQKS